MPNSPSPLTGRRRELAQAAVAVVARSGMRGLTHRAVDAEAGVPEGTTSAYLRTKAALLTAMVDLVTEELAADVDALARRITQDGHAQGVGATVDLLVAWLDRPDLLRVRAELELEALRAPDVNAAIQPARQRMLDVASTLVADHGCSEPELRASAVVASLQGILSSVLHVPPALRADYVRSTAGITLAALLDSDVCLPPS